MPARIPVGIGVNTGEAQQPGFQPGFFYKLSAASVVHRLANFD
jgi:hypothetical protein